MHGISFKGKPIIISAVVAIALMMLVIPTFVASNVFAQSFGSLFGSLFPHSGGSNSLSQTIQQSQTSSQSGVCSSGYSITGSCNNVAGLSQVNSGSLTGLLSGLR